MNQRWKCRWLNKITTGTGWYIGIWIRSHQGAGTERSILEQGHVGAREPDTPAAGGSFLQ